MINGRENKGNLYKAIDYGCMSLPASGTQTINEI